MHWYRKQWPANSLSPAHDGQGIISWWKLSQNYSLWFGPYCIKSKPRGGSLDYAEKWCLAQSQALHFYLWNNEASTCLKSWDFLAGIESAVQTDRHFAFCSTTASLPRGNQWWSFPSLQTFWLSSQAPNRLIICTVCMLWYWGRFQPYICTQVAIWICTLQSVTIRIPGCTL